MTLSYDDACAEADCACSSINSVKGASARWEHRSDGTGRKYLFIVATIEYKDGD